MFLILKHMGVEQLGKYKNPGKNGGLFYRYSGNHLYSVCPTPRPLPLIALTCVTFALINQFPPPASHLSLIIR